MTELPDFERDMPLTEADIEALWRAREQRPMTFDEYLDFLSSIAIPTRRTEPPPFTDPFTL